MNFEVHFIDGTTEEFSDILDTKPNKEDEPRLVWLKRKGTGVMLNLDQVKYILITD